MIVLDTNVLSALMRAQPDPKVVQWLDRQPAESIWTTSITLFESRYGLALMPECKRRTLLEEVFESILSEDLQGRILDFDQAAAERAALIAARRKGEGQPVDIRDTQIAAICEVRNATLATRNTRHFSDLMTPVINPWE